MKIRRVSKVVKGGRNLSFSAMMVVGDYNGRVGAALGKAASVPDAVRKGRQNAERAMQQIVVRDGTIPHDVSAKFGSAKVLLLPAAPGTGVIAGGGVRAVIEAAGIQDVLSKTFGGNNPVNTVRATLKALSMLRDPEAERARRLGLDRIHKPEVAPTEETPQESPENVAEADTEDESEKSNDEDETASPSGASTEESTETESDESESSQ